MSQTKRETRLGTTSQNGISKMKVLKTTLMILVLTLFSTAWGQFLPFVTHSVGTGPAFEVFPSVVTLDKNEEVNLTFLSSQTDVLYSVFSESNRIERTKNNFLRLSYHLNGLYDYLTIVATTKSNPWDTSVATVVVLSPKVPFDENALLTFFTTPLSTSSEKKVKIKLYAILGSEFGKKGIKFYQDDKLIFDKSLSPFVDSPEVIEYMLNENLADLKNGDITFKAQLELVSGERITVEKKANFIVSSTPTIRDLKVFPNVTVSQMEIGVKFKVNSAVPVKNVWVNGVKSVRNGETWQATLTYPKADGKLPLVLNVKTENIIGKMFNLKISKSVCLSAPTVEFVELVNENGTKLTCHTGKTTIIREGKLPVSFKIVPHVVTKCGTPQVKILVDGKTSDEITFDKYDVSHNIKVLALNSAYSTSVLFTAIAKGQLPTIPFSWWAVIGILSAMIISLFLTLY